MNASVVFILVRALDRNDSGKPMHSANLLRLTADASMVL